MRISDGFDLNVYKLMKKSGYDVSKTLSLGNVIEFRPYGLNDTQKMIQRQGQGCNTKHWPWLRTIPASENFQMT